MAGYCIFVAWKIFGAYFSEEPTAGRFIFTEDEMEAHIFTTLEAAQEKLKEILEKHKQICRSIIINLQKVV